MAARNANVRAKMTAKKTKKKTAKKSKKEISRKSIDTSSVLARLNDVVADIGNVRFTLVFPNEDGWEQTSPGVIDARPEFCRLVQRSRTGGKHCKMCHILMSIAASSKGLERQLCHANVSVLTVPIAEDRSGGLAILSTCAFIAGHRKEDWENVKLRGKELGIDLDRLKSSYARLPDLSEDNARAVRAVMAAAAEAVKEIRHRIAVEEELKQLKGHQTRRTTIQSVVEDGLRSAVSVSSGGAKDGVAPVRSGKKRRTPVLIDVVSKLVSSKPHMPFSVSEIAAAARMTPNHFSTLFRKHKGQSFVDFVTEKRMEAAKTHLCDFTMNIGEVAQRVGYDDPGYFSRLFKKKVGLTPRGWRDALVTGPDDK